MLKIALTIVVASFFFTGSVMATAIEQPAIYKKCKACHKMPGNGGKKGPDLLGSTMNLDEFTKTVKLGSSWEGRAERTGKYSEKKMRPVKKISDEDIEAIYLWVQTLKK